MKTSHIFWGLLFIGLGLLILINNFSTIFMDWSTIWKLWPLVAILLGISLLIKHKYGKGFIAGLAAIILALAIFASFKTATHFFSNDFEIVFDEDSDYEFETTEYIEPMDSILSTSAFNFDAGAGSFKINESTESLFYAKTVGNKNNFHLKRKDLDSSSIIDFGMHRTKVRFGLDNYKNKVVMNFNPNIIWDFTFNIGAASMDFDLTELKTKNIYVDMGAASLDLKVGDKFSDISIDIDAGASDIDIFIPENSGCEINTDGGLSSKNFDEFEKLESDLYQTSNLDEAENKIYIRVDSGVSSITVKRY
ncbi:MAG: hypothetical protein KJN64_14345 [Ignavibacteria bacterium]|nr:hypothetical protein [Ignavibacteria bacterium]